MSNNDPSFVDNNNEDARHDDDDDDAPSLSAMIQQRCMERATIQAQPFVETTTPLQYQVKFWDFYDQNLQQALARNSNEGQQQQQALLPLGNDDDGDKVNNVTPTHDNVACDVFSTEFFSNDPTITFPPDLATPSTTWTCSPPPGSDEHSIPWPATAFSNLLPQTTTFSSAMVPSMVMNDPSTTFPPAMGFGQVTIGQSTPRTTATTALQASTNRSTAILESKDMSSTMVPVQTTKLPPRAKIAVIASKTKPTFVKGQTQTPLGLHAFASASVASMNCPENTTLMNECLETEPDLLEEDWRGVSGYGENGLDSSTIEFGSPLVSKATMKSPLKSSLKQHSTFPRPAGFVSPFKAKPFANGIVEHHYDPETLECSKVVIAEDCVPQRTMKHSQHRKKMPRMSQRLVVTENVDEANAILHRAVRLAKEYREEREGVIEKLGRTHLQGEDLKKMTTVLKKMDPLLLKHGAKLEQNANLSLQEAKELGYYALFFVAKYFACERTRLLGDSFKFDEYYAVGKDPESRVKLRDAIVKVRPCRRVHEMSIYDWGRTRRVSEHLSRHATRNAAIAASRLAAQVQNTDQAELRQQQEMQHWRDLWRQSEAEKQILLTDKSRLAAENDQLKANVASLQQQMNAFIAENNRLPSHPRPNHRTHYHGDACRTLRRRRCFSSFFLSGFLSGCSNDQDRHDEDDEGRYQKRPRKR